MHEAKTQLSKLRELVMAGEEVVIAKAGVPCMRLVPYEHSQNRRAKPDRYKGQFRIGPDFDETSQEIIDLFEGSDS